MTKHQELFLRQARSDWAIFGFLEGQPECHRLHYLQMCTEKLGKAGSAKVPGKIHHGFVKFLKRLRDKKGIWKEFGISRRAAFDNFIRHNNEIATKVENLAPTSECAGDGPNPEYPWPSHDPRIAPVDHLFEVWALLQNTTKGRKFLRFVEKLLTVFEEWS